MTPHERAALLKPPPDYDLTNPDWDPLHGLLASALGLLAVCNIGFIGRIEGRAFMPWGKWAWVGTSLHGKPWSSSAPILLDPADNARLRHLVPPAVNELSQGIPGGRAE